jgi:hypothetical protein
MRRHRSLPLTPLALTFVLAASLTCLNAGAQGIPARLTDQEFWRLTEEISEPDGAFRSDNLLSKRDGLRAHAARAAGTHETRRRVHGCRP